MESERPPNEGSPGYALGQLWRALRTAVDGRDVGTRERAEQKAARWRAVLDGMSRGELTIGSRTPVADTPPWVTLEVVHGGFATGRHLAEVGLDEAERARVERLPRDVPGESDRERLNLWYLGDDGQAELLTALHGDRLGIDLPEDAALPVVAWLLENGHHVAALDLVAELRPLMHRLRFTPRLLAAPRPAGMTVYRRSVGDVQQSLRQVATPPRLARMREVLAIEHPLYDKLVALWCDTVEGDLPQLSGDADRPGNVVGGWPCRTWPADWAERRQAWLAGYAAASRSHASPDSHRRAKSDFTRLRRALEACENDSSALSARDVGWIRRCLANTISRHGALDSPRRTALRRGQAELLDRPTYAALAHLVADRLDAYAADRGLVSLDPALRDTDAEDSGDLPAHLSIPAHLARKVTRALDAPVDELVTRGVIGSGDVLAEVLPRLTGPIVAARLDDPSLAALYAQAYTAFRRRRSLLLLDLAHQVEFEELPWIRALLPLRSDRVDTAETARAVLRRVTLLAFTAFPEAILPNALLRELTALARAAKLTVPFVEEVAPDIFMGTFTSKWVDAARTAGELLGGSLYARYYDLPSPDEWPSGPKRHALRSFGRVSRPDVDRFAAVCQERAAEAQVEGGGSFVAVNGTVLEQSQILTTQNLAVLSHALDLRDDLRESAAGLADHAFAWAIRRQRQPGSTYHAALRMVKSAAYAWRQGIFFLSFCDAAAQRAAVTRLAELVDEAPVRTRFEPAVTGLARVVAGDGFDRSGRTADGGRRLLGWSSGPHWCLEGTTVHDRLRTSG